MLYIMHPKDRVSSDQKKGPSLPLGMQGQMGATPHTLEKPPGPLVRGSKNTPNLQPQPYLDTVRIFTILFPQSLISTS